MSKQLILTLIIIICFIIFTSFVLFILHIVSLHQKNRERFLLDMEEMKNNFRNELLQSQLEIQEQTFDDISMEIHDNISQVLLVSKLNLSMIEDAPAETLVKIHYAIDLMSRAMKDLTDLSRRLDSDLIRQSGLYRAIEEYVAVLKKSAVADILLTIGRRTNELAAEKELILFRILQEAINNILKHAEASRIEIGLDCVFDQLLMTVSDNGKGFDVSGMADVPVQGAGIKNMKKRTALINGNFSLESERGRGTRVSVELPV